MVDEEWKPSGFKKHSIFGDDGNVRPPKEGSSFTICHANMLLAQRIVELETITEEERKDLLHRIDILYDMGKRMGTKLRDYHREFLQRGLKHGGWREGY